MEKEFTWKPGDCGWFMYDNQAVCGKILRGWYKKYTSNLDYESINEVEKYYVSVNFKDITRQSVGPYEPNDLFKDKQSLINSL